MTTHYKIRNKNDHTLFRNADGRWSKGGKVYDTIGKLRILLSQKLGWGGIPEDWEIVEYEVIESAVKQPHEIIKPEKMMEALAKKRY